MSICGERENRGWGLSASLTSRSNVSPTQGTPEEAAPATWFSLRPWVGWAAMGWDLGHWGMALEGSFPGAQLPALKALHKLSLAHSCATLENVDLELLLCLPPSFLLVWWEHVLLGPNIGFIHLSSRPFLYSLTYSLRSKHLSLLFLSHLTVYPHKASLQILSCGPSHTSWGAQLEKTSPHTSQCRNHKLTRFSAFSSNHSVCPWYPVIPKDYHFRPSSLPLRTHSPPPLLR